MVLDCAQLEVLSAEQEAAQLLRASHEAKRRMHDERRRFYDSRKEQVLPAAVAAASLPSFALAHVAMRRASCCPVQPCAAQAAVASCPCFPFVLKGECLWAWALRGCTPASQHVWIQSAGCDARPYPPALLVSGCLPGAEQDTARNDLDLALSQPPPPSQPLAAAEGNDDAEGDSLQVSSCSQGAHMIHTPPGC